VKHFTIFTSRHLRKRPIAGWLVSFEPIISASIEANATAGSTTGWGICRRRACGRCAHGSGSACLHASRSVVDIDCRLMVAGVAYEVDAELAGETVVVWWGLFDQELWVERDEERFGPCHPVGGPISCTDTASTAKAGARSAPIGWGIWHSFSCCRAPLSPEKIMVS
jgi:hypothetical protein